MSWGDVMNKDKNEATVRIENTASNIAQRNRLESRAIDNSEIWLQATAIMQMTVVHWKNSTIGPRVGSRQIRYNSISVPSKVSTRPATGKIIARLRSNAAPHPSAQTLAKAMVIAVKRTRSSW